MADYFTNLSVAINLPTEAEQVYALALAYKARPAQPGDGLPADFPKNLMAVVEEGTSRR